MREQVMLARMEEAVVGRVKRHFAWAAIIVAVLGVIGINATGYVLVSEQLKPQLEQARNATAKANAEAEIASTSMAEVNKAIKKAKQDAEAALLKAQEQTKKSQALIEKIDEEAKELDKKFNRVKTDSNRVKAYSENVRLQLEASFDEVNQRLDSLVKSVPTAEKEQEEIKASSKIDSFKANSEFEVYFSINAAKEAIPFIADAATELKNLGYKVTGDEDYSPDSIGKYATVNSIHIAYMKSGIEKLHNIKEILLKHSEWKVQVNASPRDIENGDLPLVGDIQIVVKQAE
ncbi:hypothetical protein [Terasakiella sp. SH-1]|uniref:hypothetical protein n=1 Tax=Terasakiella sp. SH-1 TaxID=2560057 RepID=UPI001073EFE6|nr:hypothetical protein [Terasakiella sp. SH-1]